MENEIVKEGWGPTRGRKWHYFRFKKGENLAFSLCGKIGFYPVSNELETGNDNSPDNCAKCKRELIKSGEK